MIADALSEQQSSSPPPHSASATSGSTTESNTPTSPAVVDHHHHIRPTGPPDLSHHHHSFVGPSTNTNSTNPFATQNSFQSAAPTTAAAAADPHHNGKNVAALKMLVTNNAAGSIIGRAGQTISELQTESNTRIKLSQSGDYYPGTQDRVCLVQGDMEAVRIALRLLLERLYMMQETQNTPAWHQQATPQPPLNGATAAVTTTATATVTTPSFDFVARLLVPVSCCGMIIGKNGPNIKYMEDTTGVTSIRLSPKDDGIYHSTAERVVTITGTNMESCLHCVYLVLDGMTSHPDISRYSNMTTSYTNVAAVVGGGPPQPHHYSPSSIAAVTQVPPSLLLHSMPNPLHLSPRVEHHQQQQQQQRVVQWELPHNAAAAAGLSRRSVSTPDLLASISSSQQQRNASFQHHHLHMHSPELAAHRDVVDDYAFSATSPFTPIPMPPQPEHHQQQQQHFHLLPRHSPFESNAHDGPQQQQQHHHNEQVIMPSAAAAPSSVTHSISAPDLLAMHLESLHLSPSPLHHHHHHHHPHHHNYNNNPVATAAPAVGTFVPQPPVMIAQGCFTAQILIPDSMIGSILGRGGRTLNELQLLTATRIRISQRGEYMPGTRSRIVTVRGATDQAVWQAQFMMSQRIVLPPTAYPPQHSMMNSSASTQEGDHHHDQQQQGS